MDMRVSVGCEPFLKWPGGKRWAANFLAPLIASHLDGCYFEPFFGAGAVFLRLQPARAILSDINVELIRCLNEVASNPTEIIRRLSKLTNDRECYYATRIDKPNSDLDAAVRFIYLNKTAWGGVYRLNQRGEFNVPFGNSGRNVFNEQELLTASKELSKATLVCRDFEEVMASAGKGDVVYADPPYSLPYNDGGFLRYNEKPYGWDDQKRLASAAKKASRRGAKVIISGPWDEKVLALYPRWYAVKVARSSTIARKTQARKSVFETLLFNFSPRRNSDHPYLADATLINLN